tara:strand:- start:3417 stop:3746 length:330 start_codon:yes stop_codon:yes gene_type:complete
LSKLFLIPLFLLVSCGDWKEQNKNHTPPPKEAWICHNPVSQNHGDLCSVTQDPELGEYETCFWHREESTGLLKKTENSFCWLLRQQDCLEVNLEWQEINCHHINGDMAK